jgi:hypothetical protein
MKLFAKETELPRWQDDPRLMAVQERVDALSASCQAAHDELKALQRGGGDDKVERLVTVPSPASPMWPKLQAYQSLTASLTEARRELARAEEVAKHDAARAGYDAAYDAWRDEVVPVVHQLIVALRKMEQVRREALDRTSAAIGHLGAVTMAPTALEEFIVNVEQRGTFGDRA